MTYGSAGVAVFFVVSGFCIHLSYQRNRNQSWRDFFHRRFFRIYPPYLAALALFFFVWPWGMLSLEGGTRQVQLLTHLFSVHNFHSLTLFGINGSFWSVAVEVQLYIIYPVLLVLMSKYGWRKGMVCILSIELTIRASATVYALYFGESMPRFIINSPFAYWFSWAIGAYLAECYLNEQPNFLSRIRFDVMAAIALITPIFAFTGAFKFLAFSMLTGIAIDRLIREKWTAPSQGFAGLIWRHLSFLGVVSYSFYLFHQPIARMTRPLLAELFPQVDFHVLVIYAICTMWYPVILLLSYASYRAIELRGVAVGKFVWNRFRRPAEVVEAAMVAVPLDTTTGRSDDQKHGDSGEPR